MHSLIHVCRGVTSQRGLVISCNNKSYSKSWAMAGCKAERHIDWFAMTVKMTNRMRCSPLPMAIVVKTCFAKLSPNA
ncbi:hypothetical protein F511_21357 [Dorcoceras hygrometricum]|uniref:Uncharacterized protein n=1 Tax=Dorcoceras hygrometricum TaxID=472368 RepID=A0A2Z7BLU6_9LAMI|nr:hypothetical protein F511_21357 [Dorcoceras hygrometricum]